MPARPLVLIHGYSASGSSFDSWKQVLAEQGYGPDQLHVCTYKTLTNEVSIKDIAEALDRALRIQTGLDGNEEFDAIVHSTGMLVVRAWLASHARRRSRLKHLIGLAPATFGSPLAHKGRGWLGAIFRGNRELGPDFLEAGDLVLDGLELGSRFTWDLAHRDLIGEGAFYGPGSETPYAFIFCGTAKYPPPLKWISDEGTDGTVRLAGAALNTRKITIDLTLDRAGDVDPRRVQTAPWSNVDIPVIPISGRDHGSILSNPPKRLVRFVMDALAVDDAASYRAWLQRAASHATTVFGRAMHLARWQQFVVRVVDERDDGVNDYYLDFIVKRKGKRKWEQLRDHEMAVRPYSGDASYRCFHINLDSLGLAEGDTLGVRLVASSGTALVAYDGFSDEDVELYVDQESREVQGEWSGVIDLSSLERISFFYPFTTTLVEVRLNREPQPPTGRNEVLWFLKPE
ncbi:MAG: hypothetical protein WD314_07685 [Trueperaceae bacterium]